MTEGSVEFLGAEVAANEADTEEAERAKYVTLESIAAVCWEAHRAWEEVIGESPRIPWAGLSHQRKDELMAGVAYILEHPHASVSMQHDNWRARQAAIGNDDVGPYDGLPYSQRVKAALWRHVVHAIAG